MTRPSIYAEPYRRVCDNSVMVLGPENRASVSTSARHASGCSPHYGLADNAQNIRGWQFPSETRGSNELKGILSNI